MERNSREYAINECEETKCEIKEVIEKINLIWKASDGKKVMELIQYLYFFSMKA